MLWRYVHIIPFLFVLLPLGSIAQCDGQQRYIDPIFSSDRTYENVVYNTSLALQGACANENNLNSEDYTLDIYEPLGDTAGRRPVIVYAHGGAFLIGNKRMDPISDFCYDMAALGYVVVSIDYRKCFNTVSTNSAERAVYRAVQDMNAAIRWVRHFADSLRIDPDRIITAGNSAGSIMSILATYADESERQATIPSTNLPPAMGCMDCTGNNYNGLSKGAAVLNMWGAINNLNYIEAGDPPMISFHGDNDGIVPYASGVPFGYPVFPTLYGSEQLTGRLDSLGIYNEFYSFSGAGHEPWLLEADAAYYYDFIVGKIKPFVYEQVLKPGERTVNGPLTVCTADTATYQINVSGSSFCWNIAGGEIVSTGPSGQTVTVVWDSLVTGTLFYKELNTIQAEGDWYEHEVQLIARPTPYAGIDVTICKGESTVLAASGGNTYSWQPVNGLNAPNAPTTTAAPDSTTTYTVNVSNTACAEQDTLTVFVSDPPPITITKSGDSLMTQPGFAGYEWTVNGFPTTASGPILVTSAEGVFRVTAYDSAGCSTTSPLFEYVLPPDTTTVDTTDTSGTDSLATAVIPPAEPALFIYPNPVRQQLTIEGVTPHSTVRLYQLNGRCVVNDRRVTAGISTMTIDVSALQPGIYLLVVKNARQTTVKRITVW